MARIDERTRAIPPHRSLVRSPLRGLPKDTFPPTGTTFDRFSVFLSFSQHGTCFFGRAMHLYDFTHLPLGRRFAYAAENGTFIVNDRARRVQYFQLHDYYVEVRMNKNANALQQVVPFRDGSSLDHLVACITRKALAPAPVRRSRSVRDASRAHSA